MQVKITINSDERAVVIPINYEKDTDTMSIDEVNIDPLPNQNEDVSGDIVLNITQAILSMFGSMSN